MRSATILRVGRLVLFAAVLLAGVTMLAKDGPRVRAANTAIVVSYSNTSVQPVSALLFFRNDPPQTLYLWAVNVDDPQGLGSFSLWLDYSTLVTNPQAPVATLTSYSADGTWLGTSGRSVSCGHGTPPAYDNSIGSAYYGCFTLGPYTQLGVQGTGLIGSFTIRPGAVLGAGTLNFGSSGLTDIGQVIGNTVIDPQTIPATLPSIPVTIPKCADFNGDGQVTLFGDIFAVAARFNWNTSTPGWNPVYDLDDNGTITLFGDIFGAAVQFNQHCTQ